MEKKISKTKIKKLFSKKQCKHWCNKPFSSKKYIVYLLPDHLLDRRWGVGGIKISSIYFHLNTKLVELIHRVFI